jgi:rod shape-determining protein MreC
LLGALLGRWQTVARNQGATDAASLAARTVVGAPAAAVDGALSGTGDFLAGWLRSGELAAENRLLRQRARVEGAYADVEHDLRREIASLRKLLELPDFGGRTKVPGTVIGLFPHENRLTIRLARAGEVQPGMPVVAADGLIAIVQTVDGVTCQAMLLSAPTVRVGAIIQGDPPQAGLLRGETPERLVIELLAGDADVAPGAWVTTSGFSERIPRGIPIGRVARVDAQPEFGQRRVRVLPSARVAEVRDVVVLR